jgi:hypothetical protein
MCCWVVNSIEGCPTWSLSLIISGYGCSFTIRVAHYLLALNTLVVMVHLLLEISLTII